MRLIIKKEQCVFGFFKRSREERLSDGVECLLRDLESGAKSPNELRDDLYATTIYLSGKLLKDVHDGKIEDYWKFFRKSSEEAKEAIEKVRKGES